MPFLGRLLSVHQLCVISRSELVCWCVLPLATWTPSFVIFQSTSTPTAPQLTSVSSRLLLATARGGQCSSSLGGSVTVTSPRVETWKHANTKQNITCHYEKGVLIILCHTSQNYFLSLSPCCFQPRPSNWPHNVPEVHICELLRLHLFL